MKVNILSCLYDKQVDCHSILLEMNAKDFLSLTDKAYLDNYKHDIQKEILSKHSYIK